MSIPTIELIHPTTGAVLNINDPDGPYIRLSEAGLGPPPTQWLTERGPFQHGVTTLDYRFQQRQIGLVLMVVAETANDLLAYLDTLLEYTRPRIAPLKLRYTRVDGKVRQIDVRPGPQWQWQGSDQTGTVRKVGLELLADDPTFYDPTVNELAANIPSLDIVPWAVPLSVPLTVGSIGIDQAFVVNYEGDAPSYPTITIAGPITNCVIENTSTGEVLDFTGATFDLGDTVTIDLRYGYKTIFDQAGINRVGNLTDISDLGTWHISPETSGGVNTIRVTGTSGGASTQVYLTYYDRFTHV